MGPKIIDPIIRLLHEELKHIFNLYAFKLFLYSDENINLKFNFNSDDISIN